jgi:predicted permease
MTLWPNLRARLRGLLRRNAVADEIREELEFHVRMRAEEYQRRGEAPLLAARHAAQRVGNLAVLRDRGYDERGGGVMETVRQDVRYGLRLLWRHRGFSAVAIVTVALGIGMSTALASIIDAAMLHPLPYPHPEQLMHVTLDIPQPKLGGRVQMGPSIKDVRTLRSGSHSVLQFAVSRSISPPPITDGQSPEPVRGMEISEGYLDLYGVTPLLGRGIEADDTRDDAESVLLLGYDYWKRAFGGRSDVLGKRMRFDDGVFTIVGVLPRSFGHDTPIWRPIRVTPFVLNTRGLGTSIDARLRPGLTVDAAERELTNVLPRETGWAAGRSVRLDSLLDSDVKQYQTTARILAGAVALILVIACVNVAGLLLARGATRVPELAVRAAIGAGRLRLVRQLLTESVLLAAVGGTAGVVVAWWSLDAIVANLPMSLSADAPAMINWRVLGFSATLAVVTGLLFGLVPALRLSRTRLSGALARGSRRTGSPLSRRGGQLLIAAETMLALVLLAGAGLMLRSFSRILSVDLGFKPESIVTLEATPVASDAATFTNYYRSLVDTIRTMPGVAAVGAIDHLPLGGSRRVTFLTSATVTGRVEADTSVGQVLPGYFEAMGFAPVSGRFPTDVDLVAGRNLVVLDEIEARQLFPNGTAIGRTITIMEKTAEVIGVTRHILLGGPTGAYFNAMGEVFTLYRPTPDERPTALIVVVRPTGGTRILGEQLRQAAQHVGARALIGRVRTGTDWLDDRIVTPKQRTVLLTLLGALGLVLTLVGIIGMTTYAVARRTQEIGVRMAFGARSADVVRMMLGDAVVPVAIGLLLGIGGAVLSTRAIATFLFQTTPTDAGTFAVVAAVLATTACLAAWIPARRAARVDPVAALRAE